MLHQTFPVSHLHHRRTYDLSFFAQGSQAPSPRHSLSLFLQQLGMLLRSLGFLVQRVHADKADKILDTLCTRLVSAKKEADRELASISLKTTVLDLPAESAKSILRHIVPKLLKGTQTQVIHTKQLSLGYTLIVKVSRTSSSIGL